MKPYGKTSNKSDSVGEKSSQNLTVKNKEDFVRRRKARNIKTDVVGKHLSRNLSEMWNKWYTKNSWIMIVVGSGLKNNWVRKRPIKRDAIAKPVGG